MFYCWIAWQMEEQDELGFHTFKEDSFVWHTNGYGYIKYLLRS
jgi:hypothetical protein